MAISQIRRKSLSFTVRLCRSVDELKACAGLQKEIWGYSEAEVYPARLFVNISRGGGHVLGAYSPGSELIGFVASMPAWHGAKRYFHSLSLGVKAGYENLGLGKTLKLEQRKLALKSRVRLIEWTFDPLRAKNAFFNIVRLGAIVRRYVPDYYGPVASRLQLGLPSDRLIAEWQLSSARVKRALTGRPASSQRKPETVTVEMPNDLETLVATDPRRARDWQSSVRRSLQRCFRRGLAITGFKRGEHTSHYVLERL